MVTHIFCAYIVDFGQVFAFLGEQFLIHDLSFFVVF